MSDWLTFYLIVGLLTFTFDQVDRYRERITQDELDKDVRDKIGPGFHIPLDQYLTIATALDIIRAMFWPIWWPYSIYLLIKDRKDSDR